MKLVMLLGKYPPEEAQRRKDVVRRYASAGTEIEFKELSGSFFANQSGSASAAFITPEVCRVAIESEREGADAVLTFGSLDPGVETAAHFVDIPVLGSGRTGYHIASMIGRRIASIVYVQSSVPYARRLVSSFGVQDLVVSIRSADIGLRDSARKAGAGELKERLVELGRRAVEEDDAEVLFPQGVSMVPLHCSAAELSEEVGIPVVDGVAAAVRMAEYFVSVGVTNSRVAYPRLTWDVGDAEGAASA